MNLEERDWVGQWFEIYDRLGEPIDILLQVTSNEKTDHLKYSHCKGDGASALFNLALDRGWKINYQPSRDQTPPRISTLKYIRNILLFLIWTKPRRSNIWPFAFTKSIGIETPVATELFSTLETQSLHAKARSLKVSLNTLLFYSLNKVLERKYDLGRRSWWIPVNMRADLKLDVNDSTLLRNLVSNFTIDVEPEMSPADLGAAITNSLKEQRHWATWWWQHLGIILPESAVRAVAERNLFNNYYAGTFTNLGKWSCSERDCNVSLAANPIFSHPIGAAALEWNGKLNLSLRFYPTFPITESDRNLLIKKWREEILRF